MLNTLKRTMRVSGTSGLIVTMAIWGPASVWAQCPANESAKFTADDAAFRDMFGGSVSLNGDTIIAGAAFADGLCPSPNPPQIPDDLDCGAAYIFQVDADSHWGQVAKLTAADATAFDEFGNSVSTTGDTAIVGAHRSNEADTLSGSAYIFRRDFGGPDNWGEVVELTGSDTAAFDGFGRSVSISGDTALVGAWGNEDGGTESGSAYIFQRDVGGTENWGQVAKLNPSDPTGADFFGWSLSLSGDTALVGAWGVDDYGFESGAAYIFQRDFGGPENWGQVVKLTASDSDVLDWFGFSVSLSGDTAFVGALSNNDACPDNISCNSGSAYIFQRDFGGPDNWGEVAKLTASDAAKFDSFGAAVSLSGDTALAGATQDDDDGPQSGSAYVFQRDAGGADNWGQVVKLTATDADWVDNFGVSIALDGETAVIGAWLDDEACPEDPDCNSGSVYIFDCGLPEIQTIFPASQQRFTNASVSYERCGNQSVVGDAAEGFDPFDSAVDTQLTCNQGWVLVAASQQSQIDASSMAGSGDSFIKTTGPDPGTVTVEGDSVFQVTFELPSVIAFALEGVISTSAFDSNDDLQVGAEISLTGPGPEIIFSHSVSAGTSDTIDQVGALHPGLYTLLATAEIGLEGEVPGIAVGESSFEFTIEFALFGDLDLDGDVDLLDFTNWVDCLTGPDNGPYPEGCRVFDFDVDDDVDWADFAAFQIAFTGN